MANRGRGYGEAWVMSSQTPAPVNSYLEYVLVELSTLAGGAKDVLVPVRTADFWTGLIGLVKSL
jgi:hypothetical protein